RVDRLRVPLAGELDHVGLAGTDPRLLHRLVGGELVPVARLFELRTFDSFDRGVAEVYGELELCALLVRGVGAFDPPIVVLTATIADRGFDFVAAAELGGDGLSWSRSIVLDREESGEVAAREDEQRQRAHETLCSPCRRSEQHSATTLTVNGQNDKHVSAFRCASASGLHGFPVLLVVGSLRRMNVHISDVVSFVRGPKRYESKWSH